VGAFKRRSQSRQGRLKLIEHVSDVVFDLVHIKKGKIFSFEIDFLVVLGLIVNVPNRPLFLADRNRERSVTFLPFEESIFRKCVVNPFRGPAFYHWIPFDIESVLDNDKRRWT
jgi:hypothetical protein